MTAKYKLYHCSSKVQMRDGSERKPRHYIARANDIIKSLRKADLTVYGRHFPGGVELLAVPVDVRTVWDTAKEDSNV